MKSVSAKNLSGDYHRRWAKNVRETYRSILRDPRSSPAQRAAAKKKLEMASSRNR